MDFINGNNEDFRDVTDKTDNAIFFTNQMVEYAGEENIQKFEEMHHLIQTLEELEYQYFMFEQDRIEFTIVYDNYDKHFGNQLRFFAIK